MSANNKQIERRRVAYSGASATNRATLTIDGPGYAITGYGLKWDQPSEELADARGKPFRETVRKGAAAKAIASGRNIFALMDHDASVLKVLGDTRGGGLQVFEDSTGLGFAIRCPKTPVTDTVASVIRSTNVGVSLAFIVCEQRFTARPDGSRLREILEFAEIQEISLVLHPAYDSSEVQAVQFGTAQRSATPSAARPSVDYLRRKLDLACAEAGLPIPKYRSPRR